MALGKAFRRAVTVGASALACSALGLACSAHSSARSETDRAMSLMNHQDYAQAAQILGDEHAKDPTNANTAVLLAEADLGLAHFEMFDFIEQILGGQDPAAYVDLSVKPTCNADAITKVQGYDLRCLLYRILEHLPDVKDPHFKAGAQLLAQTYPDPATAPAEVNFLIAFIDAAKALSHVREAALKSNQTFTELDQKNGVSEAQFKFIVHNLKHLLSDVRDCLARLKYSYGKLRKMVSSVDGKPMIRVGARELDFSTSFDLADFLRFFAGIVHDHMDAINQQGDVAVGDALEKLNWELGDVAERFAHNFLSTDVDTDTIDLQWRFDEALSGLLDGAATNLKDKKSTTPAELVWNHPPRLFAQLPGAISAAWDQESRQPILDYLSSTNTEWRTLNTLMAGWDDWLNNDLSTDQRQALHDYLHDFVKSDPRFAMPGTELNDQSLVEWQKNVSAALNSAMSDALAGKAKGLPAFTPEQALRGVGLLSSSIDWVNRNFW